MTDTTDPASKMGVRSRMSAMIAAIIIIILAARWIFLPPVYWDIDSSYFIISTIETVPHWPWLSPAIAALSEHIFGVTPQAIAAICFVQLTLYGLCLWILARSFRTIESNFAVTVGVLTLFYMLIIQGSLGTEAIGSAALLLSLAASVIYVEQMMFEREMGTRAIVRSVGVFATSVALAANSRLPIVPLVCVFPATVGLYWVGSFFRSSRQHMIILASCTVITILCIVQGSITNRIICRAVGHEDCEMPYGNSGTDLISQYLRTVDFATRKRIVEHLQNKTPDPLVKEVFAVAADDAVQASWFPIYQALLADPKLLGDPILAARLARPGELERVTGTATWIFQTRGGRLFWDNTLKDTLIALNINAIWPFLNGNGRILSAISYNFARTWFGTSGMAVRTLTKNNPKFLTIFHDPARSEIQYAALEQNPVVQIVDTISGPIISEMVFFILTIAIFIGALFVSSLRRIAAFCGATLITVGGYSVLMAASDAPVVDRYRMPSSYLVSATIICLIGILLDMRHRNLGSHGAMALPGARPLDGNSRAIRDGAG
jgi:hypothetical protein